MSGTPPNDPAIRPETLRAAVAEFGRANVLGWFTDEVIRRLIAEMSDEGDSR